MTAQIESALILYLREDTGVASLVNDRIYPLVAPQRAELPLLTYQRVDGERIRTLAGPTGSAHPRLQINCFATTYRDAKTLAEAVRLALDGLADTTMDDVSVASVGLLNEIDMTESPVSGEEIPVSHIAMDFEIWHAENTE